MGYLGKIGLTLVALPFAAAIGATIGAARGAKENNMTITEVKDLIEKSTELAAKDASFADRLVGAYERTMVAYSKAMRGE